MILQASTDLLIEHRLAALGAMFTAGVVTSVLPCVYPMIPIAAGVLGGAGGTERPRSRAILNTLVYVLGLSLVYSTLGLVAGLTGSLFGAISSNPWAYFAAGNALLLAALAMLDVIPVRVPAGVLAWAGRFGGGSLLGIFTMGATSGLVAAPCGAPAFAAALTYVTTTRSAVWGFLYLFVFSVGMSALLVAVGVASSLGASLPRAGRWTVWIKRGAGILLLAMAEYYFVQMGKVS